MHVARVFRTARIVYVSGVNARAAAALTAKGRGENATQHGRAMQADANAW